jgi:cyanophycinase
MSKPKGTLIIIGGNIYLPPKTDDIEEMEDPNFYDSGILKIFSEKLRGTTQRIEIIPTASSVPEEAANRYINAFARLGLENIGVLDVRSREDAQKERLIKRVTEAEGILFTGGDQLRLTTNFGGTQFLDALRERYSSDTLVIAGTSAGAMAMSETMIYEGSSREALRKGEVKFSSGFGFIPEIIIDTHFVQRGRIGRLFQAIASNPGSLGVGLGEDTGLLITKGDIKEVIGSGLIIVVDGMWIRHTNIASIDNGELISIENLNVHVLVPGDSYIVSERRIVHAQSKNS